MSGSICFRQGRAADLETARTLLAAEGLPVEDLTAQHMADFVVATRGGMTLGIIGLESFGDVALLRSLVVDSGCRGSGLGRQLVAELESAAERNGIRELWLLTIGADLFFAGLGYVTATREDVPASLRATPEFESLCPGDAVVMRKRL